MTSSLSKLRASPTHEAGIPAPRHLSRYTAATMYPRQYDNFTGNFFPPESLGTTYYKNTHTPSYVWNFTDTTCISRVEPHIPSCQGAERMRLQQFIARLCIQEYHITRESPCYIKIFSSLWNQKYKPTNPDQNS